MSVLWVRVLTVFAHYAFSLSRIRGSSLPEGAIRRAYIIPIGYIISARIYHMHGIYHSPQAFFWVVEDVDPYGGGILRCPFCRYGL